MKKVIFNSLLTLFCFFCFAILGCNLVAAKEYLDEEGTVEQVYSNVSVYKFDYTHKTKFSARTDFYEGREIYDSGTSLKDTWFYSDKSIEVTIKHVNVIFGKDDDSTIIYKYNDNRNDFDGNVAAFHNESGSYTLDEEGLYKIVYKFEGSVKYTSYIYIHSDIKTFSVEIDEKYQYLSAFASLPIRLVVEDFYDLRSYNFLYAFGNVEDQLEWNNLTVFTSEEKNGSSSIKKIDRMIDVDIKSSHKTGVGETKKLYIQIFEGITKKLSYESENGYKLSTELEAFVNLVDDQEVIINDVTYKNGDKINFVIMFNVPVTFNNLEYRYSKGGASKSIENATVSTDKVVLTDIVSSSTDYEGTFILNTKNSNVAIVNSDGKNVPLTIISDMNFKIDVTSPQVSIGGDEVNSDVKSEYDFVFTIKDISLDKVEYYIATCKMIQGDVCKDKFDSKAKSIAIIGEALQQYKNQSGDYEINVSISKQFGNYNGVPVMLFVKATDSVGNSNVGTKYGYILDNQIVASSNPGSMFKEKNILDGDGATIIGKKLLVDVNVGYKVEKIHYSIGDSKQACLLISEDEVFKTYECLSVVGYPFVSNLDIYISDIYGNEESFVYDFKYNNLIYPSYVIDGKTFVVYTNEVYELRIDINNEMGLSSARYLINEVVIDGIINLYGLNSISSLSDFELSLVYGAEEEEIVLIDNIRDSVVVPSTMEILGKIGHLDKYKACALKGNRCDIETYLKLEYKVNGINQIRRVLFMILDNTSKYSIINFNSNIEVNVKENYQNLEYKFVDNLDVAINENNVTKHIEIIFIGLDGTQKKVDQIDSFKIGTYNVMELFTYNGVTSFPLYYSVNIVDKEAPVIKLKEEGKFVIKVGEDFKVNKDNFVITDNYDTNLEIQYSIDPEFNGKKEGKYTVSYWTIDSSGNKSEVITQTLIVEKNKDLVTYVIVGGIGLFTILVMFVATKIEIKKEKRRK